MNKIALIGRRPEMTDEQLRQTLTSLVQALQAGTVLLTAQLHEQLKEILSATFPAHVMTLHPSYAVSHQFATAAAHQMLIDEADHVVIFSDSPDLYDGRIEERCIRAGKPFSRL